MRMRKRQKGGEERGIRVRKRQKWGKEDKNK